MVHVNNDGHSDDDSKYDIDDYNGKMDSEGLLIITDQIGLCSVLSPLFIVSHVFGLSCACIYNACIN